MMKFSKTLTTIVGLVVLMAFIGVTIYNVSEINRVYTAAVPNLSNGYPSPRNWVLVGAGLGLLAGLLLGIALVLPNKTFKARYAETRKAEQTAQVRAAGVTGSPSVPAQQQPTTPTTSTAPAAPTDSKPSEPPDAG